MNSRERVLTTLQHRLADRVPLAEMWIDPRVVQAILPGAHDSNDLVQYLGLDMVTVPTMIYDSDEVEWVDRAQGVFRDKWGALQHLTDEAIPVPMLPPRIETEEDLARYRPPDPAKSPVIEKVRRLKARFPDKAVAVVGESGWAPAVYLRGGIENLFLDLAERPQFAKDLMSIGAAYYAELFPIAIAAGADVVFLGDDYSDNRGPMMSPQMFEEIILPHDAAVITAIKKAGAYCIKHTDGDIRKIMDQLVGTGLDALGPLQDVPGMELDKILERYPGRITVMGNVPVDLLARGTVEEVVAATKRLLRDVSAKGPHIMSSGNTITSCVRPKNFVAMVRTTQQCGNYPINRRTL
ncbi:MAG: uroporphyrinogen decarboxylase family protein [Verrucomicrobiae bacterium]|nr:uroporphyrinogen decarboxylase family protein [Verrucomicrobiae bacterium]